MDKKLVYVFLAGSVLGVAGAQIPGAEVKAGINKNHKHVFQSVDNPKTGEEWKAHLTGGPVYDKIEELEAIAVGVANAREYGGEPVLVDNPAGCPILTLNLKCVIHPQTGKRWEYEFSDAPAGTWSAGAPQ